MRQFKWVNHINSHLTGSDKLLIEKLGDNLGVSLVGPRNLDGGGSQGSVSGFILENALKDEMRKIGDWHIEEKREGFAEFRKNSANIIETINLLVRNSKEFAAGREFDNLEELSPDANPIDIERNLVWLGERWLVAAGFQQLELMKLFNSSGFPTEYASPEGKATAAHEGAVNGHEKTTQYLISLDKDCGFLTKTNEGALPLHLAYAWGKNARNYFAIYDHTLKQIREERESKDELFATPADSRYADMILPASPSTPS